VIPLSRFSLLGVELLLKAEFRVEIEGSLFLKSFRRTISSLHRVSFSSACRPINNNVAVLAIYERITERFSAVLENAFLAVFSIKNTLELVDALPIVEVVVSLDLYRICIAR